VLVDDLGSGVLDEVGDEPSARESLDAGAQLVCFSGDKLLGGPQAGIVAGRAELVERLRRHPLQRALRADKLTLAALEGTLALYRDPDRAKAEIPVLTMLAETPETVRGRAERLARLVQGEVVASVARAGGGALPLAEIESFACALPAELAVPLRTGEPPVIGIVRDGKLLLDCRTLTGEEVDEAAAAVNAARG
jgi:L-seryl-tRNA(Ser) seleniumtransferase